MINLRYHIVSLTAVFLAIGIGLTLGSTFLDRATVDNLNGQLRSLEGSLDDRGARIDELEARLSDVEDRRELLDLEGPELFAGVATDVPVIVVASRGVDEADVDGTVRALAAAGTDLGGIWWFTERFLLDDAAEATDLAAVLSSTSTDPSRLRRLALDGVATQLLAAQQATPPDDDGGTDGVGGDPGTDVGDDPATEAPAAGDGGVDGAAGDAIAADPLALEATLLGALFESGFLEFSAVPGGPEAPALVAAQRIVFLAGSPDVPDDVVLEPVIGRMVRSGDALRGIVASAVPGEGELSDAVSFIREDEDLRPLASTVDGAEHFDGWSAIVLALAPSLDGTVGHYGTADGAAQLLPGPAPSP